MYSKKLAIARLSLFALLLVSCGTASDAAPYAEYKPPVLPVKFVINSSGISIEGDMSLITPVGEFSVGAEYNLTHEEDSILVIIRDRKLGNNGFDAIYRVRSGADEFVAVVNGRTSIQVVDRQILIDITDANIESIEFQPAAPTIPEAEQGYWAKWSTFWDVAPFGYHPLALSAWAYDDSTISKWYGLGFLWFLIRLILALILFIFDMLIIIVFGIGTFLHVFIGITARNIFYGIVVLCFIAAGFFLANA